MAAPDLPPRKIASRESSRSPPIAIWAWHAQHREANTLRAASSVEACAVKVAMRINKPERPRIQNTSWLGSIADRRSRGLCHLGIAGGTTSGFDLHGMTSLDLRPGKAYYCHDMNSLRSVALLGVMAVGAFAQGNLGGVTGVVADTSSAVVPEVKITLTSEQTNVSTSVVADTSGAYSVSRTYTRRLPPGGGEDWIP